MLYMCVSPYVYKICRERTGLVAYRCCILTRCCGSEDDKFPNEGLRLFYAKRESLCIRVLHRSFNDGVCVVVSPVYEDPVLQLVIPGPYGVLA